MGLVDITTSNGGNNYWKVDIIYPLVFQNGMDVMEIDTLEKNQLKTSTRGL